MTTCCAGDAPLVIAKGGFSGVFPGSSQNAYAFAMIASAPDTKLWCDVQLTKDAVGICLGNINMKNSTTIAQVYPARKNTYVVDGGPKTGWFSVDFNMSELQNVTCEYRHQLSAKPILCIRLLHPNYTLSEYEQLRTKLLGGLVHIDILCLYCSCLRAFHCLLTLL